MELRTRNNTSFEDLLCIWRIKSSWRAYWRGWCFYKLFTWFSHKKVSCNTLSLGPKVGLRGGVKTLRTQDISVLVPNVSIRHFGTSAELSGHFGTSAEMSWDTSALTKILRHCATLGGKVDDCLRNSVNYRRIQQRYSLCQYERVECWPKCATRQWRSQKFSTGECVSFSSIPSFPPLLSCRTIQSALYNQKTAWTTGAALDGKNTSPEKLTTQDGCRFPGSNN